MRASLILLLAGSGRRFGAAKQFLDFGGEPLWLRALRLFDRPPFDDVVLVTPAGEEEKIAAAARSAVNHPTRVRAVAGGAERWLSVQSGLAALEDAGSPVFIHDAARPLLHAEDLDRLVEEAGALAAGGPTGLLPGEKVTDTVKRVDGNGTVTESLDRGTLRAVSTPQIFWADDLIASYRAFRSRATRTPTDDGEVWTESGGSLRVVELRHPNPKITLPGDLERYLPKS